ncbi:MAG: transporter [Deltaproteobacteria bacterium]|nr:transporter [Deltaproteobacteria bacterium]
MRALVLAVSLVLSLCGRGVSAQELEPRSYVNTPIGVNFLLAGYAYQTGDVATDPALPIEDAKVHIHSAVLAYARSFELFGTSAKADVIVPYGWLDGTATFLGAPEARKVDGFADPRFRLSVNLYGAPALTLEQFASYEQDFLVGVSVQVAPPLGQYDDRRVVNIGTNRWLFKPELGVSKAFGPFTVEVAPSVTVFTANDDFLKGRRREQDPVYAVQGHLIYRFGTPLWGSIDGTYYGGGRTSIDGVAGDDRQSNARVGATLALSVSRRHSIKLYASKAVATRVGGDFDLLGLALQYRWGGGL